MEEIEGVVRMYVTVKVSVEEMRTWPPEQISRFFAGIAMVQDAVRKGHDADLPTADDVLGILAETSA